MLAQGNDFIQEAAQTMYQLSTEETIRQQCEAREDAERVLQGILKKQERETARADIAGARAEAAKARAKAAEMRLNAIGEEFKRMREEMDTIISRNPERL